MKKILFIALFAFGMIAAAPAVQGQAMATTVGGSKKVDTTDNAEVNYLVIKNTGLYQSVIVVATKIGGTPNGKISYEVSNDGTNFTVLAAADTMHVSNVAGAQIGVRTFNPGPYAYVRVKSEGRGTASYKMTAYIVMREP